MIAFAALLLALQPAAAGAAPGDRALLDAFRSACERVDDFDAVRVDALASGWEEIDPSADPRVERLNGIGLGRAAQEGVAMRILNFRRRFGDRLIFLITSRASSPYGQWGNDCRIYHFEAGEEMAPPALEAWMGRPPTGVQGRPDQAVKRLWEPAWRDGVSIDVTHIRAGTEAAVLFEVSGNILVANAIGGF